MQTYAKINRSTNIITVWVVTDVNKMFNLRFKLQNYTVRVKFGLRRMIQNFPKFTKLRHNS